MTTQNQPKRGSKWNQKNAPRARIANPPPEVCEACGAREGEPCIDANGNSVPNHAQRRGAK